MQKQQEEEIENEITCKKLDDQARGATRERGYLTEQMSKARRLRGAERELEKAKLVTSLLQIKYSDMPTPPLQDAASGVALSCSLPLSFPLAGGGWC